MMIKFIAWFFLHTCATFIAFGVALAVVVVSEASIGGTCMAAAWIIGGVAQWFMKI